MLNLKAKLLDNFMELNLDSFINLRDQFFSEGFAQFMNQVTDKNLKVIMNLVHNAVAYVLYKRKQTVETDDASHFESTNDFVT